jgi:transposase
MSEKEALNVLRKASINGREGFFCLMSSEDLTLQDALKIYQQRDSIEKIFNSLKNEIQIKPLHVWSENSIYGALILGFLAQLIISQIRDEKEELRHTSIKFIPKSMMNLTVTVEFEKGKKRRYIYSNFDPINLVILD